LITRSGYDWTTCDPRIIESALNHRQFVIDGEVVVPGVDGVAGFNALRSRKHDPEVQLYAFNILASMVRTCVAHPCRSVTPTLRACRPKARRADRRCSVRRDADFVRGTDQDRPGMLTQDCDVCRGARICCGH